MKYLCFLTIVASTLISCEQCYECQLKDNNGNVDKTENFCGDPQQANELEAAGYTCSNQ